MRSRKTSIVSAILLPTVLLAAGAEAVDYQAQVRAGAGVSDNLGLTEQNELEEAMMTFGFDFSAIEQTKRLDLNLQSSFDYIYYDSNSFAEEVVGGLNGLAAFTLIDERVVWLVQDTYGQQLFDPLRPATPDNREDVNYFTTGPTLSLLPGSRNSITLKALYSRVDYEERLSDNDRLSGTLSVGRDIRRAQNLSLNLNGNRIEYDSAALSPSVDTNGAYVRYEATGNRNTLAIDLGYNTVEFQGGDGEGVLLSVDWAWMTSPNASLSVSAGSQYSDQGDIFRLFQEVSPELTDASDISASNAPFRSNFFAIGYRLDQNRYLIATSVTWSQEEYQTDLGEDRDLYSASLQIQRDISRKIFARADVRFRRREFTLPDRRDDDLTLRLEAGYRVTAGLDLSLQYQYSQRNSAMIGADFVENRTFLRIAYTPVWSRNTL